MFIIFKNNTMKEKPILFSTPMVQAIIADRKTETRRTRGLDLINKNPDDWELISLTEKNQYNKLRASFKNRKTNERFDLESPYGQPGDLLWVRETFVGIHYQTNCWLYKADEMFNGMETFYWKWKPSIHMTKAAARIWLKVIDIKVERLEDITETSAIAEGVQIGKGLNNSNWYLDYQTNLFKLYKAKSSFNTLWRKINGEDSYNSNPWVWVVKFEVVSKTGKAIINQ